MKREPRVNAHQFERLLILAATLLAVVALLVILGGVIIWQRINSVERSVAAISVRLDDVEAGIANPAPVPQPQLDEETATINDAAAPVEPPVTRQPEPPTTQEPRDPEADIAAVRAALAAALGNNAVGLIEITDVDAAEAVLAQVDAHPPDLWPPDVALQAAIVAEFLQRPAAAERLIAALPETADPTRYFIAAARFHLGQDAPQRALTLVAALSEQTAPPATTQTLQLCASAAVGDLGAADAALQPEPDWPTVLTADRVAALRALAKLQRWSIVETVLASLPRDANEYFAPTPAWAQAALQLERGSNAIAIESLAKLAEAYPADYDVQFWYARALARAGDEQAAGQRLETLVEAAPTRPEAWHQLGVLAFRAGDPATAVRHFEEALERERGFTYAWESLATVAINTEELPAAIGYLEEAIASYPTRATPHFLLALAQAKASRPEETATALRTALQLDPTLAEEVRTMPVFTRLFSEEALADLIENATTDASEPPATEPAS
jgi:tetratricopeptide (TPR) repeat protein